MEASVRSVRTTPISSAANLADAGNVKAGDVLIAFQSSNTGSLADLRMDDRWTLRTQRSGGSWAGTKVWQRTAVQGENTEYGAFQASGAHGVVTIIAIRDANPDNIVIASAGGTATPSAVPTGGSGVEIRYQAGVPTGLVFVSWAAPSGYAKHQVQSSAFTTSCLAARTLISSSVLPAVTLTPTPSLAQTHGFTVIVGSGGAGGEPPTPPKFPSITPTRGSALWRLTAHQVLTGTYVDDLYPEQGWNFDKRIGEPGALSADLEIGNSAVGRQLARIIPRNPLDLTSGPGPLALYVWRADDIWGTYWLTGARRGRAQGSRHPSITLRATTLDGYLQVAPILAPATYGGDQIDNARALLNTMQAVPGCNIGLALQAGLSGVSRDLVVEGRPDDRVGRILTDYARVNGGFEWMVNIELVDGGLQRTWVWGYPQLGTDFVHVFQEGQEGGDVLAWGEEIDVLRGGTDIQVRGGTPVVEDATVGAQPLLSTVRTSTAHRNAGWPRVQRLVEHPGASTDQGTLEDYATLYAMRQAGAVWVRTATVTLGAKPTLHPNKLGDRARLILANEAHPVENGVASYDITERLIGMRVTPGGRGSGKDEADLVLASTAAEGITLT